jgi:hypothetical protein
MSPSEFWESDPPEAVMFLRAYVFSRDQFRRELIRLAWQTAGLYRAKRFPDQLKKILPPELDEHNRPVRRKQYASPKQEWAMWEVLAARANRAHERQKQLAAIEG